MSEAKSSIKSIPTGWQLDSQEVSNGVYRVRLTAYFGSIIEMTGTDFDELTGRCIESANDIENSLVSNKIAPRGQGFSLTGRSPGVQRRQLNGQG